LSAPGEEGGGDRSVEKRIKELNAFLRRGKGEGLDPGKKRNFTHFQVGGEKRNKGFQLARQTRKKGSRSYAYPRKKAILDPGSREGKKKSWKDQKREAPREDGKAAGRRKEKVTLEGTLVSKRDYKKQRTKKGFQFPSNKARAPFGRGLPAGKEKKSHHRKTARSKGGKTKTIAERGMLYRREKEGNLFHLDATPVGRGRKAIGVARGGDVHPRGTEALYSVGKKRGLFHRRGKRKI